MGVGLCLKGRSETELEAKRQTSRVTIRWTKRWVGRCLIENLLATARSSVALIRSTFPQSSSCNAMELTPKQDRFIPSAALPAVRRALLPSYSATRYR